MVIFNIGLNKEDKNVMTMLLFLVFSTLLGCTPIPSCRGIILQNDSPEEIYVYSMEPFQSATIPSGQRKIVKLEEDAMTFNVFIPLEGYKLKFDVKRDGYLIGEFFSFELYKPLAWSKNNELFMLNLDGCYTEQISCEQQAETSGMVKE